MEVEGPGHRIETAGPVAVVHPRVETVVELLLRTMTTPDSGHFGLR